MLDAAPNESPSTPLRNKSKDNVVPVHAQKAYSRVKYNSTPH